MDDNELVEHPENTDQGQPAEKVVLGSITISKMQDGRWDLSIDRLSREEVYFGLRLAASREEWNFMTGWGLALGVRGS